MNSWVKMVSEGNNNNNIKEKMFNIIHDSSKWWSGGHSKVDSFPITACVLITFIPQKFANNRIFYF